MGRPSPEFRCARSEDKRPAYLGKRASRSFLALGSTSETLAVRDNRNGCLPILVNSSALNPRSSSTPLLRSMNFERGSIATRRSPALLVHGDRRSRRAVPVNNRLARKTTRPKTPRPPELRHFQRPSSEDNRPKPPLIALGEPRCVRGQRSIYIWENPKYSIKPRSFQNRADGFLHTTQEKLPAILFNLSHG